MNKTIKIIVALLFAFILQSGNDRFTVLAEYAILEER